MQLVRQAVAIRMQAERTLRGLDRAFVHALDRVLGFEAIADQVLDRTDLQAMLGSERFQLRTPRHAAVGVEDLHQHAGRFESGQQGEIAGRFGMAGACQHAAGLRHQRKDVAGLGQVVGFGVGTHRRADGMRAVVGGNTGTDAFRRFDADGEIGLIGRTVVAHHQRQLQLPATFARQREADEASRVRDHEIDVGRSHELGRHDEVAFVLAILVVHDDDHATGADIGQQFGNRGETHVQSWVVARRST